MKAFIKLLSSIVAFSMVGAGFAQQAPRPASSTPPPVSAEARTALVIGVGNYGDRYFNKLEAPEADATAIAEKLKALGFEVTLKLNATRKEMLEATDAFGDSLTKRQGVGLFYFSGHGAIKSDEPDPNYLIPAGTAIGSREDLPQEAFNAQRVANRMKDAGNRLNLIFLDACRDNPLPSKAKSASGGLAAMGGASGLMFFFATQPNQIAVEDGDLRRSLFTYALLKHIDTPGLSFMDMMSDVTAETEKLSQEDGGTFKQSPYMSGTLSGRFAFAPVGMERPTPPAPVPSPPSVPVPSHKSPILVGEVASLTGGTALFGLSSHSGTQMAVTEINASGGLLGRNVKLVTEDDMSKRGEAGVAAQKLIFGDKVVALLGEVASSRSLEMAAIAQEAGVPMISPASTNPKVTETGNYIFRVCFIDPYQGTAMAKFALSRGWKKVSVMTDVKQDYSVGVSQRFKEHFIKNGGTIVSEQSYSSADKDFKSQLTNLKNNAPDAILVSGYYIETSLIAVQARELGLSVPLLGGDGWDSPSLVDVAGKAIEGSFFSNHFSPEERSPLIQDFITKYKAENNGATPDAMAALGYDSMMVLAAAIKRAGTTEGKALRDAIAATKDHPGVTGVISLDEKRNASKPAVVLTIRDGVFRYVQTIQP